MAIDQLPDGRWKVDVEPIKGKRFRKTFKTKGEAQRFEASCRGKVVEIPDWSPRPKDRRTLDALAKRLRNPQGAKLDPHSYAQDRRIRLGGALHPRR